MVDCGVGSEKPLEEYDGTHIMGSSVWNPGDQREGSTAVQWELTATKSEVAAVQVREK